MRVVRLLLSYLLIVFVGGALLAPWIWKGAQELGAAVPALAPVAAHPFHRYVNRCLIILAVAGAIPLIRSFQLHSLHEMGWRAPWIRPIALGFAFGFSSLGLVIATQALSGHLDWNRTASANQWFHRIASAAFAAGAVALVEEGLFRGAVFSALRRTLPFAGASAIVSSLFAWVHFMERPPAPDAVGPWTGLFMLAQMMRGLTHLPMLFPALINLGLIGWMLAMARERTGSLAMAIGLHAGWVFWLKITLFAFVPNTSDIPAFWGSGKLVDGWLASAVLAVQCSLLHAWFRPRHRSNP
jgi:hypothetical protein